MENEMRIIFMGTPDFALGVLQKILDARKNVVAVVTSPDKKAGRGQKLHTSAVKKFALEKGIQILQPTNLKSEAFIQELKSFKADLQIVVAFRMLPEIVWNMPKLGTFNLHASLLPQYRGAAPINWAIINGEKTTGITTFFLKHEIDTGDIILQKEIKIGSEETAGSLHDKLMNEGGPLVVKSIELIEGGDYSLKKQKQTKETKVAPKIFKEDCEIQWKNESSTIDCFIRGLSPYPTAWTMIKPIEEGKTLRLKIYEERIATEKEQIPFGKLEIDNHNIYIGTNDFPIELQEIQLEGKKRMKSADLLNGFKLSDYKIVTTISEK